MTTETENELLAEPRPTPRTDDLSGELRVLLGMIVPGPAPGEIVLSAMQLQLALRCQTSPQSGQEIANIGGFD